MAGADQHGGAPRQRVVDRARGFLAVRRRRQPIAGRHAVQALAHHVAAQHHRAGRWPELRRQLRAPGSTCRYRKRRRARPGGRAAGPGRRARAPDTSPRRGRLPPLPHAPSRRLRRAEAQHLGADRRAAGQEQRQQGDAAVVPGRIEIAVQETLGERPELLMQQVHEQEGEIVQGVGRGQRLVELQAVEQHRPALEQDDVGQDADRRGSGAPGRSAGAARADPAALPARRGNARSGARLRSAPKIASGSAAKSSALPSITSRIPAWPPYSVRTAACAWNAAISSARSSTIAGVSCAARGDAIEQRLLIEPRHLEQPFDRLPGSGQRQPIAIGAGHRHEAPIQHRRGPPVQRELGLERTSAPIERGEVEEAVADRALHLVCALADQEHVRGMGRDPLDLGAGQAVAAAVAEEREHVLLRIGRGTIRGARSSGDRRGLNAASRRPAYSTRWSAQGMRARTRSTSSRSRRAAM